MTIKQIITGLLAGTFLSASAVASTIFTPTDGDINILDFDFTTTGTFAIFDDSNLALDPNLGFLELDKDGFDRVTFTELGSGDWSITGDKGSFVLSDSSAFIIGVSPAFAWFGDDGIDVANSSPAANVYSLFFANGNVSLTLVDVTPVPVPAAVWLMGSGLLSLAGVARRRS